MKKYTDENGTELKVGDMVVDGIGGTGEVMLIHYDFIRFKDRWGYSFEVLVEDFEKGVPWSVKQGSETDNGECIVDRLNRWYELQEHVDAEHEPSVTGEWMHRETFIAKKIELLWLEFDQKSDINQEANEVEGS